MTETNETPSSSETPQEIIARPDHWYKGKHLLMGILVIGAGLWFAYDGWKGWPDENKRIDAVIAEKEQASRAGDQKKVDALATELGKHSKHTDMDILIQKLLAFGLPLVGVAYIAWTLHATRGNYRLNGTSVWAPGTGEISLHDIHRVDKRRWDRKGIALVYYEAHHPRRTRAFKLDDFAYERTPTDQILEQIEAYLAPAPTHHDAPSESEPSAPTA
jgi:hypothetical protein